MNESSERSYSWDRDSSEDYEQFLRLILQDNSVPIHRKKIDRPLERLGYISGASESE